MKIGYARVSTKEQNLEPQLDQLQKNGCEKIFSDISSGVKKERLFLKEMMSFARPQDVIVVVRLDRLGRSLKELITLVNQLEEKNIGLVSLTENIDTTTASGKLVFNIFASLADFERNLIIERTRAGLEAARARGRKGGRKFSLEDDDVKQLITLYESKNFPVMEIANRFNISRATLYNYVSKAQN